MRRAGLVWLAVGFGTVALGVVAAWRVAHHPPAVALGDPQHPDVELDAAMTAEFGFANPVVWVLAAREGTMWQAERLARVQALTRDVLSIPGVIATDVISLASPNLRDFQVTETGLRPVYLMASVPPDAPALAALRARVEGDPNYRGTLISLDGRAAMVVANFRADADARAVGTAARDVRNRHRAADVEVYAAGASLVGTMSLASLWPAGTAAFLLIGGGALALAIAIGLRTLGAALLATTLALVWSAGVLALLGLLVLPWTAYALPLVGLLGVATVVAPPATPIRWGLMAALAAGGAVQVAWLEGPARAFAVAGLIGGPLAVLAGSSLARLARAHRPPSPPPHWVAVVALALAIAAGIGWMRARVSLGVSGYGERYLVGAEAHDLRAIARHFPPPVALALRARGLAGFVTSPDVLRALDGTAAAARADAAVANAMSLADIVKMVHRAFNENDPTFQVIPDDRGLIARYLALAYSPGFRRFIDRAFTRTAVWVYVRGDSVADLTRVRQRIDAQLAAQPIPDAAVDRFGGDGAAVLAANETLRVLGTAAALSLLVMVVVLATGGVASAGRALTGALAATAAGGSLGWLGTPIDLVALPVLVAGAVAAAALGVLAGGDATGRLAGFGVALLLLAFAAWIVPHAAAHLLGAVLAGPALAALLQQRQPRARL